MIIRRRKSEVGTADACKQMKMEEKRWVESGEGVSCLENTEAVRFLCLTVCYQRVEPQRFLMP